MKLLALVLLAGAVVPALGQGLATLPEAGSKMSPQAAAREQVLAPGLEAMQAGDFAAALPLFEVALQQYPTDGRALMLAGRAAHAAGDDAKALGYYKTALEHEPKGHTQWVLHLEIVPLYAAAGDWANFDRERATIREAAAANTPYFANVERYVIENIHEDGRSIQALEFPRLYGKFHTRYRFVLPSAVNGPQWKPYIDCESDDIDQITFAKEHPDAAAKGERSFSLDAYPAANAHGTIRLFGDGEPTYETVRELVVKNAAPLATTVRN